MTYTRQQHEIEMELIRALRATRTEPGIPLEDVAAAIRDSLGDDAQHFLTVYEDAITCPMGICDGSGEVDDPQYDSDSHQYIRTGDTKPCPHTL